MKYIEKLLASIFLFTAFYAITRYHVFGPVLWQDLPVFTINKILIFSAIFLWAFNQTHWVKTDDKSRIFAYIKVLIGLHILLSSIILKPYYLKSFFTSLNGLSLTGNLALSVGALAAALFFGRAYLNLKPKSASFLILIFVAFHLFFMGWHSWLTPSHWYGFMPPITLIAFLLIAFILFKKSGARKGTGF